VLRYFCLYIACVFLGACQHAPKIPPVLHWRTNLYEKEPLNTMNPIFYEGNVLTTQVYQDSILMFSMLSGTDGDTLWRCSDTASVHASFYYNLSPCQVGTLLMVPSGPVLLAIDLKTGQKRWKTTLKLSGEDHLSTDGQMIYRAYMRYDFSGSYIFQINAANGAHTLLDSVLFPIGTKAYARTPVRVGEQKLAYTYIAQDQSSKKTAAMLCFFDLKTHRIIQKDTIYPTNKLGLGVNKQPLYDPQTQSLYLVANNDLICYDVNSQTQRWRVTMKRDILTSDLGLNQGMLYWPGEDGFVYQINAKNGQINWATAVSGTPGKLFIHQQQLHLVGGGNGLWYIIDTKSGAILYHSATPNKRNYPNLHFSRSFAVDVIRHQAMLNDGKDFFMFDL
jgi:outer membrane protein assembly factor BamB